MARFFELFFSFCKIFEYVMPKHSPTIRAGMNPITGRMASHVTVSHVENIAAQLYVGSVIIDISRPKKP